MVDTAPVSGTPRTCIFTICSRNYLHAARTLMESVSRFAPDASRVLALCDGGDPDDIARDLFDVIPLDLLPLPDRNSFLFRYTVLELNTAIKPWVFDSLFARGFERVIYFDPDIEVFSSLQDMIDRLDRTDVLLTPHVTRPLDDTQRPSDLDLLVCGTYNLGYVGMRRSEDTRGLLKWWQRKLEFDCVVDIRRGLFVDQKWMDWAPALCARAEIVRHPGWNVAYWNLPHRAISSPAGAWLVNDEPLVFYHFSGFDPERRDFSRHQDRYQFETLPAGVKTLCEHYAAQLRRHGYPDTKKSAYAHGLFADGTPIPDLARKIFREGGSKLAARFADPAGTNATGFVAYCNEPAQPLGGRSHPLITRIAREVYESRDDLFLREQFPDLAGVHATAFAEWFTGAGVEMHRLPAVFVDPVRRKLRPVSEQPAPSGSGGDLGKWLYHTAWRFKDLTHAFVPLKTRQRIAAWLFRRAYVSSTVPAGNAASDWRALPKGLNVLGYLRAELGVGEAARATLRACAAAAIPAAALDFRKGAASRMEEEIPGTFGADPAFGATLLHLNAEQVPHAVADCEAALSGRRVIAFWNWELPELPESWVESTQFLDEIWAPSRFCQTAFSRRLDLPVTHIPYAIDVRVPPGIGRRELGVPGEGFVFLYMFDALSVPARKNPMAVVEAFAKASGRFNRPAWLVLKMINGDRETDLRRRLEAARARTPNIVTIERYMKRPELNALFQSADCYVSLHRAEGYGLTLAESMFLGKPVIATGWSANMDFMTPWNSIPVPYQLVQLEQDHGPYPAGQWWAEPDVDAAAESMVRVVNEPDFASALGATASRDIRSQLSPAAVGAIIRRRLDHLWKG